MKLVVTVKGIDVLTLRTKKLVSAARQGLKDSVPEAAQLFVAEAQALVPVVTGRLRDAIHQEPSVDEPNRQVAIVAPCVPASNQVGFDPPYARRVEFGFVGRDSLGRQYDQPAQPYMRPAFDTRKDEARKTIEDGLGESLMSAWNSK